MPENTKFSGNFILDTETVQETGNAVYSAMSFANEAVQSAKSLADSVEGLVESVPPQAKCGTLLSACAIVRAGIALVNYLSYGMDMRETLNELVDAALMTDEETAKEIGRIIEIMNYTGLEAQALIELVMFRTGTGDYAEYLEHVKKVWSLNGAMKETNPNEQRNSFLDNMRYYGYDPYTQICSDDPVNLGNGNFVYDRTDIFVKAFPTLLLKRFYNALDKRVRSFGKGWIHTYEEQLKDENEKVIHIKNNGSEEHFIKGENGNYLSVLHPKNVLIKNKNGYKLTYNSGLKKGFDKKGRLISSEDKNGGRFVCDYDEDNHLIKVMAQTGEFLSFSYNEEGRIIKAEDQTGRRVSYIYLEDGSLHQAFMADDVYYTYHYDERGRLIAVENPRNVITVANRFDEKERVVEQNFPDGGQMVYSYDEKSLQIKSQG